MNGNVCTIEVENCGKLSVKRHEILLERLIFGIFQSTSQIKPLFPLFTSQIKFSTLTISDDTCVCEEGRWNLFPRMLMMIMKKTCKVSIFLLASNFNVKSMHTNILFCWLLCEFVETRQRMWEQTQGITRYKIKHLSLSYSHKRGERTHSRHILHALLHLLSPSSYNYDDGNNLHPRLILNLSDYIH